MDGERVETRPSSGASLSRATPIYEDFPGGRADPRRPLARRPAGERAALRQRDRGARRLCSDHLRVGRAGTDADDRATSGVPDAPATGCRRDGRASTWTLIVGSGGREHALAWKLAAEPGGNEIIVAPGSDAIAREPRVRRIAGSIRWIRARWWRWLAGKRSSLCGDRAGSLAGGRRERRAAGGRDHGLRSVTGRRADRIQQVVLPRGGRGRRRADGPWRMVRRRGRGSAVRRR